MDFLGELDRQIVSHNHRAETLFVIFRAVLGIKDPRVRYYQTWDTGGLAVRSAGYEKVTFRERAGHRRVVRGDAYYNKLNLFGLVVDENYMVVSPLHLVEGCP